MLANVPFLLAATCADTACTVQAAFCPAPQKQENVMDKPMQDSRLWVLVQGTKSLRFVSQGCQEAGKATTGREPPREASFPWGLAAHTGCFPTPPSEPRFSSFPRGLWRQGSHRSLLRAKVGLFLSATSEDLTVAGGGRLYERYICSGSESERFPLTQGRRSAAQVFDRLTWGTEAAWHLKPTP